MQPKPTLAVRPPRNIEDFISGQRPAAEHQEPNGLPLASHPQPLAADTPPPAFGHEPPTAVSERRTARAKIRGMIRRANGVEVARVTVYLPPDVALKLRRHCFENGLEISEVAGKAVERYVAKL